MNEKLVDDLELEFYENIELNEELINRNKKMNDKLIDYISIQSTIEATLLENNIDEEVRFYLIATDYKFSLSMNVLAYISSMSLIADPYKMGTRVINIFLKTKIMILRINSLNQILETKIMNYKEIDKCSIYKQDKIIEYIFRNSESLILTVQGDLNLYIDLMKDTFKNVEIKNKFNKKNLPIYKNANRVLLCIASLIIMFLLILFIYSK